MRSAAAVLALAALVAAGCGPTRGPGAPAALLAPADVVARHNAWADSIQHLWSRAALMINFPAGDPKQPAMQQDLDGHVFLEKPDRLCVHGQVLGQEVFKVGMNAEKYWLWVRPRINTVWVGSRAGLGTGRFLLLPEDLMTAMGLFTIALGGGGKAEFVAQERHYVLTETSDLAARRIPMRRVWFDRQTLRPARVDFYDEGGRRLMMAELLQYERAGDRDVCTAYRVRFYGDEEVDLALRLSAVDLEKRISPRVFEYSVPPGAKERNMDEAP